MSVPVTMIQPGDAGVAQYLSDMGLLDISKPMASGAAMYCAAWIAFGSMHGVGYPFSVIPGIVALGHTPDALRN